jgi:hypothetical protein
MTVSQLQAVLDEIQDKNLQVLIPDCILRQCFIRVGAIELTDLTRLDHEIYSYPVTAEGIKKKVVIIKGAI